MREDNKKEKTNFSIRKRKSKNRQPLSQFPYICGNISIGVVNLKSSGNSLSACGYINLYDWRMVTSATPAMSPISFWLRLCSDACSKIVSHVWKAQKILNFVSHLWCHVNSCSCHRNGRSTRYNVHFDSFASNMSRSSLNHIR